MWSGRRRSRTKDRDNGSTDITERLARLESMLQKASTLHRDSGSVPPVNVSPSDPATSHLNQGKDSTGPMSKPSSGMLAAGDQTSQLQSPLEFSIHQSEMHLEEPRSRSLSFPVPPQPQQKPLQGAHARAASVVARAVSTPVYITPSSFDCNPRSDATTSECLDTPAPVENSPDEMRERSSISSSVTVSCSLNLVFVFQYPN